MEMSENGGSPRGSKTFPRQTSFARSFFSAGASTAAGIDFEGPEGGSAVPPVAEGEEAVLPSNVPVPRSRPSALMRRASSRTMRHSALSSSLMMDTRLASVEDGNEDDDGDEAKIPTREEKSDQLQRQSSWYRDALKQGMSGEDIEAILGMVGADEDDVGDTFQDEEVMEQYRIMTHHEARQRVKENLGSDVADYLESKRGKPSAKKQEAPPKLNLPRMKLPKINTDKRLLKPVDPTIPLPDLPKLPQERSKRHDELVMGEIVRSADVKQESDNIVVRCLGCRSQLRVQESSTLVRCPDCSTVSPASSTRR